MTNTTKASRARRRGRTLGSMTPLVTAQAPARFLASVASFSAPCDRRVLGGYTGARPIISEGDYYAARRPRVARCIRSRTHLSRGRARPRDAVPARNPDDLGDTGQAESK